MELLIQATTAFPFQKKYSKMVFEFSFFSIKSGKKFQTKFQNLSYSILAKVGIQIESNMTYP